MAITAAKTTAISAGTWVVDPEHTTLEFRVKHVGLARVTGTFDRFDGALVVDDDGHVRASGVIDASSLSTRVAARDAHLRSADFFDVERHREIRFASTRVTHGSDGAVRIAGDLTIRGVTRGVELVGEILGVALDDEGAERVGLELAGTLDRRDFGLTWNSAVDGGGLLVGNRVDLRLDVSAVRRR
jgi:polyisoprenoid-binding protein YceI